MGFEPPVAVYDACVLYPFHVRNLLVQCAVDGLVRARWTGAIHDEWVRNLAAASPGVSVARLRRVCDLMNRAVPDACIDGEWPKDVPVLPDPGDRHVVAAAMLAGASRIATWNLRDFPEGALAPFGLRAETPDALMIVVLRQAPDAVVASVGRALRNLRVSVPSAGVFLDSIERQGMVRFAAALRGRVGEV
jgi:hypothetical protein